MVCSTPRAAVGSSRRSSLGSPRNERAIATVCRWPPEREATGTRTLGDADGQGVAAARGCGAPSPPRRGRRPADLPAEEEVADDIEVVAQREVLVDGRDAQVLGVVGARDLDGAALPLDDALSAGPTPAITLTRVDLPAPLSPTRATTSPAWISSSTSVRAWTAPNRLETPRNASRGVPAREPSPSPSRSHGRLMPHRRAGGRRRRAADRVRPAFSAGGPRPSGCRSGSIVYMPSLTTVSLMLPTVTETDGSRTAGIVLAGGAVDACPWRWCRASRRGPGRRPSPRRRRPRARRACRRSCTARP